MLHKNIHLKHFRTAKQGRQLHFWASCLAVVEFSFYLFYEAFKTIQGLEENDKDIAACKLFVKHLVLAFKTQNGHLGTQTENSSVLLNVSVCPRWPNISSLLLGFTHPRRAHPNWTENSFNEKFTQLSHTLLAVMIASGGKPLSFLCCISAPRLCHQTWAVGGQKKPLVLLSSLAWTWGGLTYVVVKK